MLLGQRASEMLRVHSVELRTSREAVMYWIYSGLTDSKRVDEASTSASSSNYHLLIEQKFSSSYPKTASLCTWL